MRSLHGPPFCVRTFLELSHATMAPTDAGWAFFFPVQGLSLNSKIRSNIFTTSPA
ncbi:hypothetical protein SANTM175S_04731 [Streptomyces antimycoticus]